MLFITNRLLRLYPVYWTMLAIVLAYSLALFLKTGHLDHTIALFEQYRHQMKVSTIFYLIFTNIFLVGQDIVLFMGLDVHTGSLFFAKDFSLTIPRLYTFLFVPQAWSIGVEILFYSIAPFLVRRSIKMVCFLMALSLFRPYGLYISDCRRTPGWPDFSQPNWSFFSRAIFRTGDIKRFRI